MHSKCSHFILVWPSFNKIHIKQNRTMYISLATEHIDSTHEFYISSRSNLGRNLVIYISTSNRIIFITAFEKLHNRIYIDKWKGIKKFITWDIIELIIPVHKHLVMLNSYFSYLFTFRTFFLTKSNSKVSNAMLNSSGGINLLDNTQI